MSCSDIPSLLDLQNTKRNVDDFSRLVEGTPSGYSTNENTGETRPTFDKVIEGIGIPIVGNFTTGCTVTQSNQGVQEVGGSVYRWSGTLPKTVPPLSSPASTGGISPTGDWVDVGDSSLRGALSESTGLSLIGATTVIGLRSIEPTTPNQRIKVYAYDTTDTDQVAAGEFYYHQADNTSVDDGGICIVTAGGKRWKRLRVHNANVHFFGPRGAGVTDHAPAFNRAVAYANARSTEPSGTTIYHPDGTYDYRAGINPVEAPSVAIIGESVEGVTIIGAGQELFKWGRDGVTSLYVGAAVKNMTIDWKLKAPETVSSGKVLMLQGMSRIEIDSLKLRDVPTFIQAGKTEANFASNILVSNIRGYQNNCGLPLIDLVYGAGMEIVNATVFVGGVGHPSFGDTMTTLPGTIAIRGWLGYWDTFQATNCLFERFASGLSLAPSAGKVYQNFFFVNCIFDYLKGNAFDFDGAGSVTGIKVIGGWLVGWEGYGISISSTLYANHIEFISTKILLSGLGAIFYSNQNARNIVFDNIDAIGCNHKNPSGVCASFIANSRGFKIKGGSYNRNYSGEGMQPPAPIGIQIGADCDFYSIDCPDVSGTTAAFSIAANASGSKNRKIVNNGGQLDSQTVNMGPVGAGMVNKYPFDVMVSVAGSTTGISLNGNPLNGLSSGWFIVRPGATISVTGGSTFNAYPS